MNNGLFKFLFGCSPEDIADRVILTPFMSLEKFSGQVKAERSFKGRFYSGMTVTAGARPYTALKCGIGAQLAADCVFFLGGTQVKNIIYAGSCGGLKDSAVGDLILCEKAFDGTGCSKYRGKDTNMEQIINEAPFFEPAGSLSESLSGVPGLKRGNIFTIGSLAAESAENMEMLSSRGFRGVDMEIAAVYGASAKSGIGVAGILFVSDLPVKAPFWKRPGPEENKKYNEASRRAIKIVTDCILEEDHNEKTSGHNIS